MVGWLVCASVGINLRKKAGELHFHSSIEAHILFEKRSGLLFKAYLSAIPRECTLASSLE